MLASNHVSYLDPLTLAWVADRRGRHVRFLAKAELFDKPVLGSLLRAAHQIPVRAGPADAADALVAAVDALRAGRVRRACSPKARSRRISSRWSASRAPRGSRGEPASPITPVGCGARTAS